MARPAIELGDTIGGYPIGEKLGGGGLGTVYATVGKGGEALAIKLVEHGGDAAARVRVEREVAALTRLDHPNVLALADAGADEHWSYLVTPRLHGTTLRQLVEAGPLVPELAALLVMHAARGAGAIHRAGLCHRDLKPDNIMITDDGRVVIIDLGLALASDWTRQTTEGSIAGSLPYMAPEQIEGDADARSDVWSLAVTWWELVTGKRPFARGRAVEEIAAIAAGARPAIADVERRIDERTAELVERCLSRDAVNRPADGDVLAREIAACVALPGDEAIVRVRSDRAALLAELAGSAAARSADQARALAAAGDVFRAMRAIDRGLAYVPGDPALQELLATIMPGVPAVAAESPAPRPRRRWPFVVAALALIATGSAAIVATRTAEPAYDFRDPKSVVQAVIDAVRSDDVTQLPALCTATSRPAVKRICTAAPGAPGWQDLQVVFQDAVIAGDYRTAEGAIVTIRYGAGAKDHATLELVRVDGRFYLERF